MSKAHSNNKLTRWLPVGIIGAMWVWFCGPMMLGMTVVGFRDSAYLYFPMFEAIDLAWAEGKVPLWNPFCNFGMPLVADGTSSVFYPGKLIFFARFLSYPSRYGIYLSTHVLLAAWSTYWLARTLRCNRVGATLAAISFAFGGPAIFQVTNVIYLVSAAWLPIAIGGVWKFMHRPSFCWSVAAAAACAMMILGGDPQMVYHVGLVAAVSIGCNGVALVFFGLRKNVSRFDRKRKRRVFLGQLGCLAVLVLATSCLAAVQILPTAELAERSERSAGGKVVNLYSMLENTEAEDQPNRFLELLTKEEHIVGQYQFSLPPWALMEMLAPNISGKPFPRNERWTDVLPSNDRMWFASLYVGLIVVVLAMAQVRFWGGNHANVWLSWILVAFLFGSFGWYGAVWAWREIVGVPEGGNLWAAPVGGVYWWMSVLLPKYFSFRYPAKLFVVASLAISLLAGRSLGPALRSTFSFRWSVGVCVLLADLVLVVFLWFGSDGYQWFEPLAENSMNAQTMYGPFQSFAAGQQLRSALVHTMVLVALFVGVFAAAGKAGLLWGATSNKKQVLGWMLVVLTSADLVIANHWLLAEVPAAAFQSDLAIESKLAQMRSETNKSRRPTALVLANHFPFRFLTESSDGRLTELANWQHQSLQARHHLLHKVRLIGSFHSIWPEKYQRFVSAYVQEANQVLNQSGDWLLDPDFLVAEVGEETVSINSVLGGGKSLRLVKKEIAVSSVMQKGFENLLHGNGKLGDASIVEESFDWNESHFAVRVHQASEEPSIELPMMFDPGWRVKLRFETGDWKPVATECTSRDLLKVALPSQPGRYEIQMNYWPAKFYWGAGVSFISWVTVLAMWIKLGRR